MKPQITITALGPGAPALLTLQAAQTLRQARCLVLRTERHPVADWLREEGVAFDSLDSFYDRYDDFDEMHRAMAAELWRRAAERPVVFAVPDPTNDGAVTALRQTVPEDGSLKQQCGVSRADSCLSRAAQATGEGIRVVPAMSCERAGHHPSLPLLITELDDRSLAGDVKLWLTELYDDEQPVLLFPSTVKQLSRAPKTIPLCELDRQHTYDHTVAVLLPALGLMGRERYCFDDLVRVMDVLRGEGGCPWDREQTHESLRRYLIEEAWEAVSAIDEGDPDHIADELGDVLLQVVFHARVAKEHGDFTIGDITTDICRKMIARHEHIFGDAHCETADDVSVNWEKIKKKERGMRTTTSVLEDVPEGLPSLMRAAKVQKKAAQGGFTLPEDRDAAEQVRAALAAAEGSADEERLGELLFACAALARRSGADPEMALRRATDRFIRRFARMEEQIKMDGKALQALTLREMDVYWNGAFQQETEGAEG